jgi:predicted dehydrogenase
MEQLRLAFIGCGGHSSNLLHHVQRVQEVDLVAVCDLVEERARMAARRGGALAWYTDFQKMLDAEKPDAVAVVGPPSMEIEVGKIVLDRGCHLFIEKPVGQNTREAKPLLDAARRSTKQTQVGFNQRHAGAMRFARELVQSPEFGRPTYMESRHWQSGRLHPYWNITDPQYAWLMLHGIHAVDMLRYVFGEVDEVYGLKSAADSTGSLVALCRFANGANGVLNLHSTTGDGDQMFEAVGSTGRSVHVTHFDQLRYSSSSLWAPCVGGSHQGQYIRLGHGITQGDRMGYRTEFRDFATALLTGEKPFPSVEDGYRSTRLAEAIYASVLGGKPVRVEDAPVIEI